MKTYLTKLFLQFILHVFWIFPVKKNRITLLNELSFKFGDNLKYLYLYFQQNAKDEFEIIFPLVEKNQDLNAKTPSPFSLKYFFYLLTSRVIITNAGGISYLPLRKKQIVINTWHGGGPYKKTGTEINDDKFLYKATLMNGKKITYMLSSCKYFSDFESKSLLVDEKKLVPAGLPRNDIFFSENRFIKEKVYSHYKLNIAFRIVLYAPTFRDTNIEDSPDRKCPELSIDYELVCNSFKKRFGGEWIFAYRLHPKLSQKFIVPENTMNFSDYSDMQELLYAADGRVASGGRYCYNRLFITYVGFFFNKTSLFFVCI